MPTHSCSTIICRGLTVAATIDHLARAGFQEIEILAAEQCDSWLDDLPATQRRLRDAGLRVRTVHSPEEGWDNANPDETSRRTSLRACADSFGWAAELGAESVICHPNSGSAPFTAADFGASWQRSRESLAWLAECARAASVQMAVENMPAYGLPRPGASMAEVLRLIEGLGAGVGLCVDAGHATLNKLSAAAEVMVAGRLLLAVHIQDNDGGAKDQHVLPGRGITDWEAFRRAMDAIGFAGARTFEVGPGEDIPATLAVLVSQRALWSA